MKKIEIAIYAVLGISAVRFIDDIRNMIKSQEHNKDIEKINILKNEIVKDFYKLDARNECNRVMAQSWLTDSADREIVKRLISDKINSQYYEIQNIRNSIMMMNDDNLKVNIEKLEEFKKRVKKELEYLEEIKQDLLKNNKEA